MESTLAVPFILWILREVRCRNVERGDAVRIEILQKWHSVKDWEKKVRLLIGSPLGKQWF